MHRFAWEWMALGALGWACRGSSPGEAEAAGSLELGVRWATADVPGAPEAALAEGTSQSAESADAPPSEAAGEPGDTLQAPEIPEETSSSPVLGMACETAAQCPGGLCLGWPGGYCSAPCAPDGCPGGGVCVPTNLGDQGFACLDPCSDEAPCPPESGQACKRLVDAEGALRAACHPVAEDAGGIGEPCETHDQCAGSAGCATDLPGGYCTQLGCDAGSCPPGAACALWGGLERCLLGCSKATTCPAPDGFPRACEPVQAIDGSVVKVCLPAEPAGTAAFGAACQADAECQSGWCEVLGTGRCATDQHPCTVAADCLAGQACAPATEGVIGRCGQKCSAKTLCPGGTLCAGLAGTAAAGVCRATCDGVGDTQACAAQDGFACTFGYPLGDASGQGHYLCRRALPGEFAQPCKQAWECENLYCDLAAGGAAGLCMEFCNADQICPFPGLCVNALGGDQTCYKACFSELDCPAGMICAKMQGSWEKVCQ